MTDPITAEIIKIGVAEAAKAIFKKVLDSDWLPDLIKGKDIVEQLSSLDVHSDYIVKHVSRAMKMRTIHSSEKDVMLNDIYHPLSITHEKKSLKIDDGFYISDNNITNIIGFAGQGKSTILRKMLIESIKNGDKIPFFMELRKIEKIGVEAALIKNLSEIGVSTTEAELEYLLKSGNVCLLLDGFDEISSSLREKNLTEIIDLNKKYDLQIITTSRDGTEICNESGIINYKVNKINRSDILAIIKKLSNSNEVEKDTLPQILHMLKENSSLVSTLNSPLLVTLFYICYPHLDSIPNNAVEFYSKLFTTLYFRHDKIKNFRRERRASLNPTEAFECFCALCFKSLFDNRLDFTHHSLIEYTNQSLKMIGKDSRIAEDMAYDFIDITCLIQKDGYDRYVFLHKSIQEYHAAEFVKALHTEKKKTFMAVILKSLKEEPKFMPTARYLYDIDRENTFNLICLELCMDEGIDSYESNRDEFIKRVTHELIREVRLSIRKKEASEPEKYYISTIGPFFEFFKIPLIFTRYFQGENSNPYTKQLVDYIVKERVMDIINDGTYTIHKNKDNKNVNEVGHVYLSEIFEKHEKTRNAIIKMAEDITDAVYNDIYKENKGLIEKKDIAIRDLFGF